MVVPNTPATPAVGVPASQPVASASDQLAAAQRELSRARETHRRALRASARASATAASSTLLSDRLDAERKATQLQFLADDAAAESVRYQDEIQSLQLELQPVATWAAADPFHPAAEPNGPGAVAVSIAEQYLGVPYRWGGADPTGFDCSGLTVFVYAQLGIQLRHYAADQWNDLPHVDASRLQPGDLVFFEPRSDGPGHVGIFAGGDSFIEAPHTGDVVKIASLSQEAGALGFVGAARPAPALAVANPFAA
jgi:cell wall-associated NlpC family hydrolase